MTIAVLRNSEGQFLGNIAQKDRQEHCKTLWCWFDGSQANHSDGGESLVVVTTLKSQSSLHGHLLKLNKKKLDLVVAKLSSCSRFGSEWSVLTRGNYCRKFNTWIQKYLVARHFTDSGHMHCISEKNGHLFSFWIILSKIDWFSWLLVGSWYMKSWENFTPAAHRLSHRACKLTSDWGTLALV